MHGLVKRWCFTFKKTTFWVLLWIYLLCEILLTTCAVFHNNPLCNRSSKEARMRKKKKKDEKEDFKQPNDATISQQLSPLLISLIILSFVWVKQPPLFTSLYEIIPEKIRNTCARNKELQTQILSNLELTTFSYFSICCRTFHILLPLFNEGECQETVEDSPLLWPFSTWGALWYGTHT